VVIDRRHADRARAARRLPGDRHHAEQRLRQQVLPGPLGVGAVGAVAGRRGVDQRGIAALERLIAEAELLHHAGPKVLRHHVGALGKPQRDVAPLRRFKIEREVALIPVGAQVQHALAIVPDVAARPMTLPGAVRGFDRNHVGAEVAEHLDAHGPEQKMIEADDADAIEQVEHAGSSNNSIGVPESGAKWTPSPSLPRFAGEGATCG
jgi:hypothetical protein